MTENENAWGRAEETSKKTQAAFPADRPAGQSGAGSSSWQGAVGPAQRATAPKTWGSAARGQMGGFVGEISGEKWVTVMDSQRIPPVRLDFLGSIHLGFQIAINNSYPVYYLGQGKWVVAKPDTTQINIPHGPVPITEQMRMAKARGQNAKESAIKTGKVTDKVADRGRSRPACRGG